MRYEARLLPAAARALDRLDERTRRSITRVLRRLADEPRPPGGRRLSGEIVSAGAGLPAWRVRMGDYRAIYVILEERILVLVVRIAQRREVCRP